eukprot:1484675-Amphidinium_carterae.1
MGVDLGGSLLPRASLGSSSIFFGFTLGAGMSASSTTGGADAHYSVAASGFQSKSEFHQCHDQSWSLTVLMDIVVRKGMVVV